ncbi:MAG: AmmeMemoRadiSam system protein B [Chlorobi bacterium]|nr:AmmeMemoRadiSam system protein B [Chlorobiota bacterium]
MKTRKPAVAGKFYPRIKTGIEKLLDEILYKEKNDIQYSLSENNIIGGIVPHAGYMFSAYQAVHFYEILRNSNQQFDTFIIINPNHTGHGEYISIDSNDIWETPLGNVNIDDDFRSLAQFPISPDAQKLEHSAEVQLPMLQYFLDYEFQILPITMSVQNIGNAKLIANTIYKVNQQLRKNICLIASSDFSHFVEPNEGRRLDRFVIDEILKLNSRGVQKEVEEKNISVCGYGPIMTLMEYSKQISNTPKVKVLKMGNSGEVVPSNEVVDYVGLIFTH